MYFRKIRPSATCLYSDGSSPPRILSAALKRSAAKSRSAGRVLFVIGNRISGLPVIVERDPSHAGRFCPTCNDLETQADLLVRPERSSGPSRFKGGIFRGIQRRSFHKY